MLDWIIVGGGPHGVHLAVRLHDELGIAPDRIAILDPAERLLDTWRHVTARVGMRVLRSTSVHHLDTDPRSLRRLARDAGRPGSLIDPYARPTLALWNEHADRVVARVGLARAHRRAWVRDLHPDHDGVSVDTSHGTLRGRQVALATGLIPAYPAWADRDDPALEHVLAPGATRLRRTPGIAVIGAGLTGVQTALHLADLDPTGDGAAIAPVTLVSPHEVRVRRFDVDPGWLGPRRLDGFAREPSPDRRRAVIEAARQVGSIPPEVRDDLDRALRAGRVLLHRLPDHALSDGWAPRRTPAGWAFDVGGASAIADRLVLATGLRPAPTTSALVDAVRRTASPGSRPRLARCGSPVPDRALRWHPRVRVVGDLAGLELGPAARNLAGARAAASRIVADPDPGPPPPARRFPSSGETRGT